MISDETSLELKLQQSKMLQEFQHGLDVSPIALDPNVEQFIVSNVNGRSTTVIKLNESACKNKQLIFSAFYTAYYRICILGIDGDSAKTYVYSIVPSFISFLNIAEITSSNRVEVLKSYETYRVKTDGVKTQSTGLKELIYLLNKALEYLPFGRDGLSNDDYRYLDLLTKTKPAASDDVVQRTLTAWFGFHSWLRRDDIGIGNELYNRLASPKALIKSLRITVETALIELHQAKHALIELFKEQGVSRNEFPYLIKKPIYKDYIDGKENPNYKKDAAQHKVATLNYKREFITRLSNLVQRHAISPQLKVAIDAFIYSQCPENVITDVERRFIDCLKFKQQVTLNNKIETVFRQDTPNCLLFNTEFILELLEYAQDSKHIPVPTCRAEHFLFSCLMANQTVAVNDIFRIKLSNFKFLKRQNKKITHIECDYFKSRAHKVHSTEMIEANTAYGEAILAFIEDRTAGFLLDDLCLVTNKGISNLKTGSSSVAAIFFHFLAKSSIRLEINKHLIKGTSTSAFLDAVKKILTLGVKKETFTNRNKIKDQEWLACCESPCSARLFGLEHIKTTSVHSNSDTFDPTKLVNYRSHSNETERSDYLTQQNEIWQNNCGRITRSIMHDLEINVMRPSVTEKATFQSDFINAIELVQQRKNDILSRLKLVTEKDDGRVDSLGFDLNRNLVQGDLPDSIYLVDSPETVMKLKHYLTELEYKHERLFQNATEYLFYTALPTAEWIESVFSNRFFSRQVVTDGEILYKKFREHLPPLFVSQAGGY